VRLRASTEVYLHLRNHRGWVGRHDHEDRVRSICEQDDGSAEGDEKDNDSEKPSDDRVARLHHAAAPIGQLPLDEEGAIVELKSRELSGEHFTWRWHGRAGLGGVLSPVAIPHAAISRSTAARAFAAPLPSPSRSSAWA